MLAAGASERLPGAPPKQLLQFRSGTGGGGGTLLHHAAHVAVEAGCGPVVVVLGSRIRDLKPELAGLRVEIVENRSWRDGLSTSIRAGLDALERKRVDAAMFTTCDQPRVGGALLKQLADRYIAASPRPPAVACAYAGTLGVPALFDRDAFQTLRSLSGDQGAKPVLERYGARVIAVPFEDAALDIDTPDDVRSFLDSA